MKQLTVYNIPEEMFEYIGEEAKIRGTSMSATVKSIVSDSQYNNESFGIIRERKSQLNK